MMNIELANHPKYLLLRGAGFRTPTPEHGLCCPDFVRMHTSLTAFTKSIDLRQRIECHKRSFNLPEGTWRISQIYSDLGQKNYGFWMDGELGMCIGCQPDTSRDAVWLFGTSVRFRSYDEKIKAIAPMPFLPCIVQLQGCRYEGLRDALKRNEIVRSTLKLFQWEQIGISLVRDWAACEGFPAISLIPAQWNKYWTDVSDPNMQNITEDIRESLLQRNHALIRHYNEAAENAGFIPYPKTKNTRGEKDLHHPWIYMQALTRFDDSGA